MPAAVAVSPLLYCFAQSKLPSDLSDRTKSSLTARTLHRSLLQKLSKEFQQYFTHQGRDDFMAMPCGETQVDVLELLMTSQSDQQILH